MHSLLAAQHDLLRHARHRLPVPASDADSVNPLALHELDAGFPDTCLENAESRRSASISPTSITSISCVIQARSWMWCASPQKSPRRPMKRGQSLDWPLHATGAPGRIRTHDPLVRRGRSAPTFIFIISPLKRLPPPSQPISNYRGHPSIHINRKQKCSALKQILTYSDRQ